MKYQEPQILTPVDLDPVYKASDYLINPDFTSEKSSEHFNEHMIGYRGNHYPVVLSGSDWRLSIQSKPKARIYRTGRIPTYQEIASALQNNYAPIWTIELFQVLIELAEVES